MALTVVGLACAAEGAVGFVGRLGGEPAAAASPSAPAAVPAPVRPPYRESAEQAHLDRLAAYQDRLSEYRKIEPRLWKANAPRKVVEPRRLRPRSAPALIAATAPAILSEPAFAPAPIEVGQTDHDCLAQAVYYEARSEPLRGQEAVAQVVMNRLHSPYYPKTVCNVVFQGATRSGCQFSFACDGSMRRGIRDTAAWARAQDVAERTLEGTSGAGELAPALNYHADYVRPKWASRLAELEQIGRHIFYQALGGILPEGGAHRAAEPPSGPGDNPLPAWA